MKIKRFFAKDMRSALKEVKETLGADAVIMSKKKLADGIELVAAIDEADLANKKPAEPEPSIRMPRNKILRKEPAMAQPKERPAMTEPFSAAAARPQAKSKMSAYDDYDQMDSMQQEAPADSLEALLKRQNAPAGRKSAQFTAFVPQS